MNGTAEKPLVIVADRFSPNALAFLQSSPSVQTKLITNFDADSPEASQAQVLIVRTRIKINEHLLSRMPKLKIVITATSGFDHFDFGALKKHDVTPYYCPNGNRDSAAELTWSLVTACARRIPAADRAVHDKNWNRDQLWGTELAGKTYGVIGLGRIGKKVARIAQAFGMTVKAYDPYVDDEAFSDLNIRRTGYIELLRESDVISVHVPYSKDTHHMLNRATLSEASRHLILVNTSRGSVVRETDLAEMLMQGELAAAGLDVYEREPLSADSLLLTLPNLVLTPHIGANTHEAFEKVSRIAAETAIAWASGRLPQLEKDDSVGVADRLPPKALWFTHPQGFNS